MSKSRFFKSLSYDCRQILLCDRITAENYLMQSSEPSIIIRFADTDQGLIQVVIRDLNTRRKSYSL